MKEKHGYLDEQETTGKKFENVVVTLSPTDPKHCVTIEEAHKLVEEQVLFRAKHGFKYLFVLHPYGAPWHKRYEILHDGTYKEMPYEHH